VEATAHRGGGGPELEQGRLLEEEDGLLGGDPPAGGDAVEDRGHSGRAPEAGSRRALEEAGGGDGHQENDLGTSGTPANGGRSGDGMSPCAAARR